MLSPYGRFCDERDNDTTTVVVPADIASRIDNIFERLVAIGCQLAMSSDGIRDGIALRRVFKKHSVEAQQLCLAAGVLVAEGWLRIVTVQGQLKGFIRAYPKEVRNENLLPFPVKSGPSGYGVNFVDVPRR